MGEEVCERKTEDSLRSRESENASEASKGESDWAAYIAAKENEQEILFLSLLLLNWQGRRREDQLIRRSYQSAKDSPRNNILHISRVLWKDIYRRGSDSEEAYPGLQVIKTNKKQPSFHRHFIPSRSYVFRNDI